MTQLKILTLASREALRVWTVEHEFLEKHPEDEIAKIKEEKSYKEYIEIAKLLKEAEATA